MWYLGFTDFNIELEEAINKNEHILLIKNKELRQKYQKFFDINLIPERYRSRSYYENYKDIDYLQDLDKSHILNTDEKSAKRIMEIFHENFSPSLIDDESLKDSPKSYIQVQEWDGLKDENLIYAHRLKQAGSIKMILRLFLKFKV